MTVMECVAVASVIVACLVLTGAWAAFFIDCLDRGRGAIIAATIVGAVWLVVLLSAAFYVMGGAGS